MPPLTDDDLAYMREVQAEHRPDAATLYRTVETADGLGGRTRTQGPGEPVQVRVDTTPDAIPARVAERYAAGQLAVLTLDLVEVSSGDRIVLDTGPAYEVVTDGETDRWATAQQVTAHRVA